MPPRLRTWRAGQTVLQPVVFPWPHHERTLWVESAAIWDVAGIDLPCRENPKHTDAGHR
jgi:hypothetical protein